LRNVFAVMLRNAVVARIACHDVSTRGLAGSNLSNPAMTTCVCQCNQTELESRARSAALNREYAGKRSRIFVWSHFLRKTGSPPRIKSGTSFVRKML
jgi:hypothetical protein